MIRILVIVLALSASDVGLAMASRGFKSVEKSLSVNKTIAASCMVALVATGLSLVSCKADLKKQQPRSRTYCEPPAQQMYYDQEDEQVGEKQIPEPEPLYP